MLLPRQEYRTDSYWRDDYSAWDWGRWVLLAGILGFVVLCFLLSCASARRRRRAGLVPFRGTGWLYSTSPPPGHGPATYSDPHQQPYAPPAYVQPPSNGQHTYYGQPTTNSNPPAPPYSPPMNGFYSGAPAGHPGESVYHGHQTGIELQPPAGVYLPQQGSEPTYVPPAGPPPGHSK